MNENQSLKKIIAPLFFSISFVVLLNLTGPLIHFLPAEFKENYFGLFGLIIALLMTWGVLRFEKKSWESIGFRRDSKTLPRFLKGSLIGFGIGGLMIGILFILTDVELTISENFSILYFVIFSSMIFVRAFMEEIAFRGWAYIRLNKVIGIRATIIITSIVFAWYHDLSFDNFGSTLLGPGIWGFVYAWAVIKTGGISFPTGIHFGVNLLQSMLGMKGHFTSFLWVLDLPADFTPEMLAQVETIGVTMQVVLFVIAVIAIEWLIRKEEKKGDNIYLN